MDIFSKNTMNFIQLRWYRLTLWLMDYMICSCINKHTSTMGHASKQCNNVAMQLQKWTNMHMYIMDQSSKQCSYIAMQLRKLTKGIDYGPKQQAMRLCCHAAAELDKHGPKQQAIYCHVATKLHRHAWAQNLLTSHLNKYMVQQI